MKVFLSYAVGPLDAAVASRLRAVAAAYDVAILLPDRTAILNGGLPSDTVLKINQSDAVIALLTKAAHGTALDLVNAELQVAAQRGKSVIAFVETGANIQIQGLPGDQVVHFDPFQPTAHEHALMQVLQGIRGKQQQSEVWSALGWIAGIALGLIALNELVADKE